jgi:cytochrome c-type biogenesis protein CcmF
VTSREASLVFNNIMLTSILGIVLLGTLYPLVTEAMGVKVSVGPPYFTPMSAVFAVPMLVVLAIGPLLRWRHDRFKRVSMVLAAPLAVTVIAAIAFAISGVTSIMSLIALSLAPGLAVASLLPLRGATCAARRSRCGAW